VVIHLIPIQGPARVRPIPVQVIIIPVQAALVHRLRPAVFHPVAEVDHPAAAVVVVPVVEADLPEAVEGNLKKTLNI
jgi:hypothetical protein